MIDRRAYVLGLIAVFASASVALACKYSVRDVAFVDLGADAYRLRIHLPANIDAAVVHRLAMEALTGSTVRHEIVTDPPADGIAITLTAPDGRTLDIPTKDATFASIDQAIASVIESGLRKQLLKLVLEYHSVILVINGSNPQVNARAKSLAEEAMGAIDDSLPSLPKPIARAPVHITLNPAQAKAERVLLFSLGIEATHTRPTASIAVVYGRLRRLGPVLEVPPTGVTDLVSNLHYVGQDCECELDRSWMTGPMVPHRWTPEREQAAVDTLDFDPGSPLVHTEVRQILARGPSETGRRFDRIGQPRTIDPLLGYTETEIEPTPAPQAIPPAPPAPAVATATETSDGPGIGNAVWLALGLVVAIVLAVGVVILRRGAS